MIEGGGSMPNEWLEELQEQVANCWEWLSPALQISFRYIQPDQADDFWEIWAYPAVQEIIGGKEDGETVSAPRTDLRGPVPWAGRFPAPVPGAAGRRGGDGNR
jgi:hypothetical protein